MQVARPSFALHPYRFGRGRVRAEAKAAAQPRSTIGADVKLFATTFLGGFLLVSILIG